MSGLWSWRRRPVTYEMLLQAGLEGGDEAPGGVDEVGAVLGAVDGGVQDDLVRRRRIAGGHGPGQGIGAVRHPEAHAAHDLATADMKAAPVAEVDDPAQLLGRIHRLDLLAIDRQAVNGELGPDLLRACRNIGVFKKFHCARQKQIDMKGSIHAILPSHIKASITGYTLSGSTLMTNTQHITTKLP